MQEIKTTKNFNAGIHCYVQIYTVDIQLRTYSWNFLPQHMYMYRKNIVQISHLHSVFGSPRLYQPPLCFTFITVEDPQIETFRKGFFHVTEKTLHEPILIYNFLQWHPKNYEDKVGLKTRKDYPISKKKNSGKERQEDSFSSVV